MSVTPWVSLDAHEAGLQRETSLVTRPSKTLLTAASDRTSWRAIQGTRTGTVDGIDPGSPEGV